MSEAIYRGYTKIELEKEYSPSSCVEDINIYLQQYAQVSQQAREVLADSPDCHIGIPYGDKPKQTLDLFLPEEQTNSPLHIFIHGGYWQELDKSDSSFGALSFLGSGIGYCAINYTLAPDANIEEIIGEVRQAIAWLYQNAENYGYDKDRLYISGSSAGAHLATMMLYTDWSKLQVPQGIIKGVCAVSGIYDLAPIQKTYINDPLNLTDHQTLNCSPSQLNPLASCPIIIAYGDNETHEFKRQSLEYGTSLKSNGFDVTFQEIKSRNHFDVILDLANPDSWLFKHSLLQIEQPK